MTAGNGHAPKESATLKVPASLFICREEDCGVIEGIGRVAIREVVMADVWDVLDLASSDQARFSRTILAKSLVIDGGQMSEDDIKQMPFSKFRLLQDLLPRVLKVNGIAGGDEPADTGKAGKKSADPAA